MCFLKSKSRAYVLDSVLVAVKIELISWSNVYITKNPLPINRDS